MRAGWLVALFAALLSIAVWLPWLTSSADGGGHANAIGGRVGSVALPPRFGAGQLIVLLSAALLVVGAMAGRDLFRRLASVVALVVALLIAGLIAWYYRQYVAPPVAAGYGLYLGAAGAAGALGCSVWALADSVLARDAGRPIRG